MIAWVFNVHGWSANICSVTQTLLNTFQSWKLHSLSLEVYLFQDKPKRILWALNTYTKTAWVVNLRRRLTNIYWLPHTPSNSCVSWKHVLHSLEFLINQDKIKWNNSFLKPRWLESSASMGARRTPIDSPKHYWTHSNQENFIHLA